MAVLRQLLGTSDILEAYELYNLCEEEDSAAGADQEEFEPASRFAGLARTIETEIVPRLMLAHKAELTRKRVAVDGSAEPTAGDIKAFAAVVVKQDLASAHRFVIDMRARGASLETVFLSLMAPTARHLGDLWVEDRLDFTSVTLGLSRLQQLLRALSPAFGADADCPAPAGKALLVTFPGEQHTFGMYMVAEFFRRDGWEVWGGPPEGVDAVFDMVADDWFDVLGVSVSLDSSLSRLGSLIGGARRVSRNEHLRVLAGGRALSGNDELAVRHGADGVAADGRHAVHRARELVGAAARPLA